jgi:predicted nucleic acid-binding protein
VNVYVDTNLIVARSVAGHPHQPDATQLFRDIRSRRWTPVISAHGLAEIFSVLTKAPFARPISPSEAAQIIEQNVVPLFKVESLSAADYASVIQACASNGWGGGRIYDAIHLHTARRSKCSRIFTLNLDDFRRIAPDLRDRIQSP